MHVEDTASKEQMLREIILWASEVKNHLHFLRHPIIILIFAIET